jgi:hypothetical protein
MQGRFKRQCITYDLLLAVFRARYEVHGFHMSDVDFVTKYVCEDDLRNISGFNDQRRTSMYPDERTFSSDTRPDCRLLRHASPAMHTSRIPRDVPLNLFRIFAISLLILFSSSSRTLAPRISAMN